MIHDSHLAEIEKLLCAYGRHAVEIDAIDTLEKVKAALTTIHLCRMGYPGGIAKEPEDDSNSKVHTAP